MTTPKYIDKLTSAPVPLQPKQARIALRYSAGKAAKGTAQETAEMLQETFDNLVALAGCGFLGAQGLEAVVEAPEPDLLEVRLNADPLPLDFVVIALRLVISANDNSPEDFQRLLGALDGDMETALQVYGGTNFEEEVTGIELSVEGDGPAQAFDPFHLGEQPGSIRQAQRLTVQGWAQHMPDEETEDHILRLSGMRAFLPVGVDADYEPGDEEYFPSGDDLLIDTVSIEDASLRAILAMLAPPDAAGPAVRRAGTTQIMMQEDGGRGDLNRRELTGLFPLPYTHWYAANLFGDAGYPWVEILARLGIESAQWRDCNERYRQLHFANTSWVASAYRHDGLPEPEQDRALFDHLTAHDGIGLPVPEPFSMRRELGSLRRAVEANPRIGPFADVDWIAHYICERRFPTIRYIHNGSHVFADGAPISDRKGVPLAKVDPLSFRQLADRWFRDDARIYGQGETPTKLFWFIARGADPDSFTVLNERYGADKAAGYYITNLRLPTEEPGTFGIVSYYYGRGQKPGIHVEESHYAKDSRKVYAYGVEIEGADAPGFHAIGDEGHYFADRNRIYWENKPIPDADRESFTCASEAGQYQAYDKDRPCYAGQPQSVSAEFDHWRRYFEAHPEIADSWWHREQAPRGAAISATGQPILIGGPYFSDGSRIMVRPERRRDGEWISLDHFDHGSFRHLAGVFGQDRHGLRYFTPGLERYGHEPVKGADPASFEQVDGPWFRDKGQVYYFDSEVAMPELSVVKADLASFQVLGDAYARDAKGLIVEGVRKRGIDDPAAVQAIGHFFARMGETLLYRGKPVTKPGKVDPTTARGVHDQLLIDANGHMLFGGSYRKPIPGMDPATLNFLNRVFAADARHVYAMTDTGLLRCEEIDREHVQPNGLYAARVADTRFRISGGRLVQTSSEA